MKEIILIMGLLDIREKNINCPSGSEVGETP